MANIMINENCNQKCSYCFAAEFVNLHKNDISFVNFKKAVEFILTESDKTRRGKIGLIGGEPLMHPQIDTFLDYLIERKDIEHVTIYTNGVLLEEHLERILNNKVSLLINVNSVSDVGEKDYRKTTEAIDLLVREHQKKNRITLGLNIYDNIDYTFFVKIASKYGFSKVRLSVVVPAYNTEKEGFNHFVKLKESVLKVTKSLLLEDIRFSFDCNWPVPCMWSDEELKDLQLMGLASTNRELIPLNGCICQPVIDIRPDLTAIRCFGLSDISKISIEKFDNIQDLRWYYYRHYDSIISRKPMKEACVNCALFPSKCYGGCLANRISY